MRQSRFLILQIDFFKLILMASTPSILQLAKMSLMTLSLDGTIVEADAGTCVVFDLEGIYNDLSELEGKKLYNIMSLKDKEKDKLVSTLQRATTAELVTEDRNIKTLRGTEKRVELNFLKIVTEEQETFIKLLAKDITDLKFSEKKLENINLMYKTLIGAAPIGILLVDSKGIIREFNSYLVNMMGAASAKDFLEKDIFTFSGFQEINFLDEVRSVLKDRRPAAGEKRFMSGYGKATYFSYVLVPVPTDKESEIAVFGIIEDRTKIRELTEQDNNKR